MQRDIREARPAGAVGGRLMARRGSSLILALTAALAMSACGGGPSAPASSAPASTVAGAASASAAPSAVAKASSATSAAPSAVAKTSSAPASAVAKPSAGTIKIGFSQVAPSFTPIWIAQDKGLFKKYGIDTDVQNVSPPADRQALLTGDIQIDVDGSSGVPMVVAGSNVTYIAVPVPFYVQSVYAVPSIQKVSDLAGKTISAASKGGSNDLAAHTVLAKQGVDVSKVNFVYLRDDGAQLAALQSGATQAGVFTAPSTVRARQAGLKELINLQSLKLHTITNGVLVRKDWAQQHPNEVEAFLKGLIEGIKLYQTDPAVAKTEIAKYTKQDDQALIDATYNDQVCCFSALPLVHDEDVQNVIDLSDDASTKTHKPAEFYDNSYLQKLSAFVKDLYPQGVPAN